MFVALLPLRGMTPGFLTLVAQIVAGAAIYGAMVLVFDIAGLRGHARAWLRARR
jgi:hypothetical protein